MIISVRLCHPFVSESSEQTTISHTVTHDTIAFTYHIRERDGVLFANRLAFNMVLFFWFLGWSWLFDCSTPHIYDAYEIFFNHHPISTIHQHIIRQCRGVYARLSVVFSLSLSLSCGSHIALHLTDAMCLLFFICATVDGQDHE